MILKKCSAAAALLGILCLAGHMGTMCFSLFTGWYVLDLCKGLAHLTLYCIAVHALLSVCSIFFFHDGADNVYKKENRRWIFQRGTAILIVLLLHAHTRAYGHMATGEVLAWWEAFLYCCCEVLYIASVTVHAAVSFSGHSLPLDGYSPKRRSAGSTGERGLSAARRASAQPPR